MLLSDEKMSKFIDSLLHKEEIELGNSIKYKFYANRYHSLEEINYFQMERNLWMIYGDEEKCEIYLTLFDKMRKFVANILQVPGLSRLFSQHYYNIEWNMYTEPKFDKNRWSLYRDHFVHQIRNAYMGYELLWGTEGFFLIDTFIRCYHKEQSGDFASFINTFIEEDVSEEEREKIVRTIFFKAWFISALFHDIGYPLAHFNRYEKQIVNYMPYFHCISSHTRTDFLDIKALLADSYLFQEVPEEELRRRYLKDDHGMLSALCLLLNYYHTGTIHSINKIDRCSIELAAYSIFAHTNSYGIQQEEKRNSTYYRPVFWKNPLAFLLRVCDDLQEWERVYFLIGNNKNILICEECFSTIIADLDRENYRCKCGKNLKKITQFGYRKLNLVSVCQYMQIEWIEEGCICVNLDYDKLRLIEAVSIHHGYAKYRYQELKNLEKLLVDQEYFPFIKIKYFLSDNIPLLKYEILRNYLKEIYPIFSVLLLEEYGQGKIQREKEFLEENRECIGTDLELILSEEGSERMGISDLIDNILSGTISFLEDLVNREKNKDEFPLFIEKIDIQKDLENIYFYFLLEKRKQK